MVPSKYLMTMMIIVMMISFYFFARHVSHFLVYTPTLSHLLTHSLPSVLRRYQCQGKFLISIFHMFLIKYLGVPHCGVFV